MMQLQDHRLKSYNPSCGLQGPRTRRILYRIAQTKLYLLSPSQDRGHASSFEYLMITLGIDSTL